MHNEVFLQLHSFHVSSKDIVNLWALNKTDQLIGYHKNLRSYSKILTSKMSEVKINYQSTQYALYLLSSNFSSNFEEIQVLSKETIKDVPHQVNSQHCHSNLPQIRNDTSSEITVREQQHRVQGRAESFRVKQKSL